MAAEVKTVEELMAELNDVKTRLKAEEEETARMNSMLITMKSAMQQLKEEKDNEVKQVRVAMAETYQ